MSLALCQQQVLIDNATRGGEKNAILSYSVLQRHAEKKKSSSMP